MSNVMNAVEFFARWKPDEVAIQCGDEAVTWRELDEQTGRLASGFIRLGMAPGQLVGILGENSLEWVRSMLGVLRAGLTVVPVNNKLVATEIRYVIEHSEMSAVVCDAAHSDLFAAAALGLRAVRTVGMDDGSADHTLTELGEGTDSVLVERDSGDAAIVAYTSGTTGFPKGAILTHGNLQASAAQWRSFENWNSSLSMLLAVPMAFTGSLVNFLLNPLGVGGRVVLERKYDPARVLALIAAGEITAMVGVPQIFEGLARLPGFDEADLSALTTALTGGAPVPAGLLKTYQAKGVLIRQTYALTESAGSGTTVPVEFAMTRTESAGLPGAGCRVRIQDGDGNDQPLDTVGEIHLKGPQVSPGYWRNPEATADRIIDGWLKTGDLGRLDGDGMLEVVDRRNDIIISGGANVYPAEIERAVAGFPGVAEVAAYGVPHEKWGQTVAVSVGGEIDSDTLYALCVQNLSKYKVPRYILRVEQPLPRSMSGKVLRRVLRDAFDADAAIRTAAP